MYYYNVCGILVSMNTELALYQHYPCIVLSCVYCIYNCVYCMFLENPFISTVVCYLGNPIEINTFKSNHIYALNIL